MLYRKNSIVSVPALSKQHSTQHTFSLNCFLEKEDRNDDCEAHSKNILLGQNHVSYLKYGRKLECVNNLKLLGIVFVGSLPSQQGVG